MKRKRCFNSVWTLWLFHSFLIYKFNASWNTTTSRSQLLHSAFQYSKHIVRQSKQTVVTLLVILFVYSLPFSCCCRLSSSLCRTMHYFCLCFSLCLYLLFTLRFFCTFNGSSFPRNVRISNTIDTGETIRYLWSSFSSIHSILVDKSIEIIAICRQKSASNEQMPKTQSNCKAFDSC